MMWNIYWMTTLKRSYLRIPWQTMHRRSFVEWHQGWEETERVHSQGLRRRQWSENIASRGCSRYSGCLISFWYMILWPLLIVRYDLSRLFIIIKNFGIFFSAFFSFVCIDWHNAHTPCIWGIVVQAMVEMYPWRLIKQSPRRPAQA